MTQNHKKILALKQASQDKSNNTLLKVITTMRVMKEKDIFINFESVAKLAGVSKTWLYRQPELSKEISQYREKTGKIKRVVDLKDITEKKDAEIRNLKNKNSALKSEVKKLRHQIEIIYGELYLLKQSEKIKI